MALHLYVTRSDGHVYMYMVHTQDTDQYHLNTYCSHWGFRIYNTLHHKYARHYYRARIIYWKRVWTRTRETERERGRRNALTYTHKLQTTDTGHGGT